MVGCVCTLAYYTDLSNRSVTLDLRQSLSGVPIMFSRGFFVGPGVIRGEIYIYVIFYERVTLHLLHWWFCINLDLIRIYVSLKKCNTVHAISHNLYHRPLQIPFPVLVLYMMLSTKKSIREVCLVLGDALSSTLYQSLWYFTLWCHDPSLPGIWHFSVFILHVSVFTLIKSTKERVLKSSHFIKKEISIFL